MERTTRRLTVAGVAAALATVLTVALAGAHPSFDVASVPADATQRIDLQVPVESDEGARNVEIGLHLPAGFVGAGCLPSLGWTCEVDALDPSDVVIRWVRVGGLARPETFVAVIETPPSLGVRAFVVDQHRSDGSFLRWDDPPSGTHPAPRLRVTAAGTPRVPNDSPPTSHAPTTTTEPPPPTVPSTTAPGGAAPPPPPSSSSATTTAPPTTAAPTTSMLTDVPTTITEIPERGEAEAVPPGGMALELPDEDDPEAATLTPARIAVGFAAGLGALMTWLLLRRANAVA